MPRIVFHAALASVLLAGCAPTQPAESAKIEDRPAAPVKCSACHLPPQEHSLPAERWERYLKNHRRRIRLTEEEKAFLHDFLVGGPPPASSEPPGAR
ncbi:MAG TPA: hypothetical protein VF550_14480 [Polyangia bacterium]